MVSRLNGGTGSGEDKRFGHVLRGEKMREMIESVA